MRPPRNFAEEMANAPEAMEKLALLEHGEQRNGFENEEDNDAYDVECGGKSADVRTSMV